LDPAPEAADVGPPPGQVAATVEPKPGDPAAGAPDTHVASLEPTPVQPPPTPLLQLTPVERISRYVAQYDGSGCLFAVPTQVAVNSAQIDAFANTGESVTTFESDFTRNIGFDPDITERVIYSTQCSTVDFLQHTRPTGHDKLTLELRNPQASPGQLLSGRIRGYSNRNIVLLHVSHYGIVTNISTALLRAGDSLIFDWSPPGPAGGGPYPELLVAVASDTSFNWSEIHHPAEATPYFQQLLAKQAKGQNFATAVQYYLLMP
jgi:hypothetical protein